MCKTQFHRVLTIIMYCKICGDIAKGSNYGVISCMSCKVFFQRHGLKNIYVMKTLKCRFPTGRCQINPDTRKYCTYCRLVACLQAGMRRNVYTAEEMIEKQQRRLLIEQKYKCAELATLDLLHADRSSLSRNQWNLISNIAHTYDTLFEAHKKKIQHLHISDEQKPMKMRLKLSNYEELVTTYFSFTVPFLEQIPDYRSLESSDRSTIIHHNMITLTGIHSHFMISTTGFIPYLDKNYAPIMNMIYGSETVLGNERLRQRSDRIFHADLFIVKLVLAILAFSNFTSCLSYTPQMTSKSMNSEMMFSKRLLTVQNNYVDVLWRYMLFRFRNENLVTHLYSNIIYNCLHVQNFSRQVAEQNELHKTLYNNLVEHIETKLNVHDEI